MATDVDTLFARLMAPHFRNTLTPSTHTCTAIHYRMAGKGRAALPVADPCGRDLDRMTTDGRPMCSEGHPTLTTESA